MQHLDLNPQTLRQVGTNLHTPEGLILKEDHLKDVLRYHGLPETLVNIDRKFSIDTSLQVLQKKVEKVPVIVDESNGLKIQVLDPKSVYVDDEEYRAIVDTASKVLEMNPTEQKQKGDFGKSISFQYSADSDSFFSDAYHKAFEINRMPQGGLYFSVGLLRLACTNGAIAHDKEFQYLIRKGNVDESVILAFADKVKNMNLDEYFRNLFMSKGEYLQASVADYLSMRDCLSKLTDTEYADLLYPVDQIRMFYEDQDIDITSISRANLHRLPSGIRYYEAFNILTNGAKQAEPTLQNQVEVAKFSSVAKLRQLRDSDIRFHGAPQFDPMSISRRMGDIPS